MRQNVALLIIVVVVVAGAAGVWAMTNMSKFNQTLNLSSAHANNTPTNPSTVNNSANTANTQSTSTSGSSNSNNGGSNSNNGGSNNGNGGSNNGGGSTVCPVCDGVGQVPIDPSNPNTQWKTCPRCHGSGYI